MAAAAAAAMEAAATAAAAVAAAIVAAAVVTVAVAMRAEMMRRAVRAMTGSVLAIVVVARTMVPVRGTAGLRMRGAQLRAAHQREMEMETASETGGSPGT